MDALAAHNANREAADANVLQRLSDNLADANALLAFFQSQGANPDVVRQLARERDSIQQDIAGVNANRPKPVNQLSAVKRQLIDDLGVECVESLEQLDESKDAMLAALQASSALSNKLKCRALQLMRRA